MRIKFIVVAAIVEKIKPRINSFMYKDQIHGYCYHVWGSNPSFLYAKTKKPYFILFFLIIAWKMGKWKRLARIRKLNFTGSSQCQRNFFKSSSFVTAANMISKKFDVKCLSNHVDNHLRIVKTTWGVIAKLRNQYGCGWDKNMKMIRMSPDVCTYVEVCCLTCACFLCLRICCICAEFVCIWTNNFKLNWL